MVKAKNSELIDLFVEGFRTYVLWEVISIELYFVSWEAYSFEATISKKLWNAESRGAPHRRKYYELQRQIPLLRIPLPTGGARPTHTENQIPSEDILCHNDLLATYLQKRCTCQRNNSSAKED